MNYYAQGGQAHGLKSLTGHEIQTKDGVPSFGIGGFFQKNVMKPIVGGGMQAVKAVQNIPGIKQVSDVSTQAFKPIDQALVGLDKTVGKAIPGGWGTIAQTVAAMTPGMQPLAIGLGAANGSGVMRKGGSFNLQGAMIGGATAYAASELGEYLRAAGGASDAALLPVSETGSAVGAGGVNAATGEIGSNLAGNASGMLVDPSAVTSANTAALNSLSAPIEAGAGSALQVAPPPSIGSQIMSGNFGDAISQAGTNIGNAATNAGNYISDIPRNLGESALNAKDAVVNYDYGGTLGRVGQGMSDTGAGIKNLMGLGEGTVKQAMAAGATSGVKALPMLGLATYGTMSLMDQEAQLDYLKQQKAAGNIAQAEYDQAVAEIARQRDYASDVVSKNPFSTNPSRDASIGDTYYGRSDDTDNLYSRLTGEERLYAVGGSIDDESGMDEARGMMQGNLQKGLFGQGYAAGGQPRFLSGGGDGMSDSIKASIEGNQEARLADGEFVIPADVVSHLGNGSSKAGAKQLYSMMDKVRSARTGRKSQGKQINPRKYLAA
jgi:hypothetical protein